MSVKSLCNHNVVTIESDGDIKTAAELLRETHVGCLIVTKAKGDHTVPIGVLTDRDLVVEVLAQGVEAESVTVADIMSRDLVTVQEDNSIELALREMGRAGVRRVPVVDADYNLVGILSVDDIIDHIATLVDHIAAAHGSEQRTETRSRP